MLVLMFPVFFHRPHKWKFTALVGLETTLLFHVLPPDTVGFSCKEMIRVNEELTVQAMP